jgi:hypothetical protein
MMPFRDSIFERSWWVLCCSLNSIFFVKAMVKRFVGELLSIEAPHSAWEHSICIYRETVWLVWRWVCVSSHRNFVFGIKRASHTPEHKNWFQNGHLCCLTKAHNFFNSILMIDQWSGCQRNRTRSLWVGDYAENRVLTVSFLTYTPILSVQWPLSNRKTNRIVT